MEKKASTEDCDFRDAFERLERVVQTCCSEGPEQSIAIELRTFLALSRTAEGLVRSLENAILQPESGSIANQL
jgi:hypothetical protein